MLITLSLLEFSKYNRFKVVEKSLFIPLTVYFLKIGSNDFFLNF